MNTFKLMFKKLERNLFVLEELKCSYNPGIRTQGISERL